MANFSKPYKLLTTVLAAFMIFVYAGLGVMFLFFPDFVPVIKGNTRILLSVLLILYAIWRVYRIMKQWREGDEEE